MLKDSRKALATATGAIPYLPDRIQPPVVLVSPSDPYIRPETPCDNSVFYDLTLIAARQDSNLASDALDDEIDRVLAILPQDYLWLEVSQPFVLNQNGADYLSAKVKIQTTYQEE